MVWPVPLKLSASTKISRRPINLFMALIKTKNPRTAVKPASAFFVLAKPTAKPTQKISPKLLKMATREPDKIVPNPLVTGLSKNGSFSISNGLVNKFPTAIKIPAIGKINTGMNIALENRCKPFMIRSFIFVPPTVDGLILQ